MRNKDQILLEEVYTKKVLKENDDGGDRHGYFPDKYGNEPLDGVDPVEMQEVDDEKISLIQITKELGSNLYSTLTQLVSMRDTAIKIMRDEETNDATYLKVEKEYDKLRNIIRSVKEFLSQE